MRPCASLLAGYHWLLPPLRQTTLKPAVFPAFGRQSLVVNKGDMHAFPPMGKMEMVPMEILPPPPTPRPLATPSPVWPSRPYWLRPSTAALHLLWRFPLCNLSKWSEMAALAGPERWPPPLLRAYNLVQSSVQRLSSLYGLRSSVQGTGKKKFVLVKRPPSPPASE